MSALTDIETRLKDAAAAIGTARDMAADGVVVDLAGLETGISETCEAMAGLPAEQRQTLKPALVTLIDGLNALAATLTEQRAELAQALKGSSTRQRAASAYSTRTQPRDPPDGTR
jgi:hypothetical protein